MTSTVETGTGIRPFTVDVPEEKLTDLPRRIAATQWPEKETVADQRQGVPLAMMQELARRADRARQPPGHLGGDKSPSVSRHWERSS